MPKSNVDSSGSPHFRWGIELTPDCPVETVASQAQLAEELGFDAAFVSSHYHNRDPVITVDRIAAATDSLQVGPGVANPYDIHPVRLAAQIATLQEASNGRTLLGLGPGDTATLASLGITQTRPVGTLVESISLIRQLLTGEHVDIDDQVTAHHTALNFSVGEIPILIGAQGPDMLRMAAKHADGLLINAAHPLDYEWASERIAEGLTERPATRDRPTVAAFASVSIDRDPERARAVARAPVAFITGGAPTAVLKRHGIDLEIAAQIDSSISANNRNEAYELVTENMIDAFCIAGDPADVGDRISDIRDTVGAFVAASPLGAEREAAIDLLGSVIE